MSGGIIISRSLWDDPVFRDQAFSEREAWVWMVSEASWKAREKRIGSVIVATERGQFAASVRFMAERFGWSKSAVSRFLDRLKKRDMIGTQSGTGVLVITLCNYDKYQSTNKKVGTATGTDSGTAAGQQRDKLEEGLNKGEIKKGGAGVPFSDFWDIWPNRVSRASAEKAWAKLSSTDREVALNSVDGWFATWRSQNPTASPIHAATYLNQKRFLDEQPKFTAIQGGKNASDKTDRLRRVVTAGARGSSNQDWG